MAPTIHFDAQVIGPEEFEARSARSAAALRELGVGPGDVVALMLHNEPVLLELIMASRRLGARWCLINWHFKAGEVRHILSDSDAKVFVVHSDLLANILDAVPASAALFLVLPEERTTSALGLPTDLPATLRSGLDWGAFRDLKKRPNVAPETPGSVMLYTSGTSGLPKGIRRERATPEQIQLYAQTCREALGIAVGMRALIIAPMYHAAPASYAVQALLHGALLWIEPRFDAEATLRLIELHAISHLYLVPTLFQRLLRLPSDVRKKYDLGSLRYVACGGSPCPPEIKRQMIEWWGPVIHETYGASEFGYVTHIDSAESAERPGSVGRAIGGATIRILDETGAQVPAGSPGLIYARQAATPDFTYSNNDEARRRIDRDGLWTLGDVGYLDPAGYLYIVDRKTDMVISGGVNIYPAEIETHLSIMPGVADCAVFGVPDEEFGESLMAAVELIEGVALTVEQVQSFLRQRMAGYKVPGRVIFHPKLPREDTGKIFKRQLREPYWMGVSRRV